MEDIEIGSDEFPGIVFTRPVPGYYRKLMDRVASHVRQAGVVATFDETLIPGPDSLRFKIGDHIEVKAQNRGPQVGSYEIWCRGLSPISRIVERYRSDTLAGLLVMAKRCLLTKQVIRRHVRLPVVSNIPPSFAPEQHRPRQHGYCCSMFDIDGKPGVHILTTIGKQYELIFEPHWAPLPMLLIRQQECRKDFWENMFQRETRQVYMMRSASRIVPLPPADETLDMCLRMLAGGPYGNLLAHILAVFQNNRMHPTG